MPTCAIQGQWGATFVAICLLAATSCARRPESIGQPGDSLGTPALLPACGTGALAVGVVGPNLKVRPLDSPALSAQASLFAAKNEFEPFQIVLTAGSADVAGVSARLSTALTGAAGAIPASNVTLYRVDYYDVTIPSNTEGSTGLWPDALVPDVDTYVHETRNAFPMSVPAGQNRVIWVDVLVPSDAAAGTYQGEVEIDVDGARVAGVPVELRVGNFALPSTSSYATAFDMGWSDACRAHYDGVAYCDGSEDTADALRALYVRAGLEHRFSIARVDFQPPLGSSRPPFEAHLLPYIQGTGAARLAGAAVTAVILDDTGSHLSDWVSYSKAKGFFDRLVYYPVDEPGDDGPRWGQFASAADALHAVDPNARVLVTGTIEQATAGGAADRVDLFVPVINFMDDNPKYDSPYAQNQRSHYDAWLAGKPNRALWSYQSCMSFGCGSCGGVSNDDYFTRWPSRVIDVGAVQNRAFPWIAFEYDLTGELYFQTTADLSTAWTNQCDLYRGNGDGNLFYPGTPARIGGQTHIPIESMRMKLIREGIEDYEYLQLAAQKDSARAHAIASGLFPQTFACNQPAANLEAARAQLFAMLDPGGTQDAGAGDAGAGDAGAGDAGAGEGGTDGQAPSAGPDPTLLPAATTSQVPLTSQYDALNVPSIPAGGFYLDPTTGVRIYKLTSAAFPTAGSDWIHDYTEGGDEVSLPYNGDGVTRAVFIRSPSTTFWWLVDFTPGPAASGHVGNARQLPAAVTPLSDVAFAFSNNPATPYYAYVGRSDGVHRIDIRTLMEAPDTGPNPAWPVADQDAVWLHQSANDEMFVWMRGGNGPTTVAYKPGETPGARMKTFTIDGMNEPRIDRGGRYVGVSMTTPQNEGQIWDWDTNGIVHVAPGDIPFAHIASLRRRWIGMDWNSSFPSQFTKFVPDEGTDWIHRIGGPANTDLFHASGNWIQNPPNLDDQWALVFHYGSLQPPSTWAWLAPGGMIFITPNGERRLLGHPYNTNPNYNWLTFAKPSSDGRYVLFTSDMDGSGRSDQFLAEVPVRTASSPTWTRIEENDPSVVFSGTWFDNNNGCQSGGSAKLAMDAGALATFNFTGTGVRWIGVRDEWSGIAQVSIDGVVQSPLVDTYETPGQCQRLLFEKTGLPTGAHELGIEVTATKSAASQGLWVWVDAFEKE